MPSEPITRRHFIQIGCLAGAALGLTVCGGAALAELTPVEPPIGHLPSFSYGEKNMNNRVLVAYASANGSTADIAIAVGKALGARGFSVDVKPIQGNPSIDGYDSVVVGSAVHRGHWLVEAVEFVKANQAALGRTPVALFTVHITSLGGDDKSRRMRESFSSDVRALVRPVTEAFFAGKFDRRGAALLMPGFLARLIPTFDLRDWTKIDAWSQTVSA